jgi:hypothetical protein
MGKINAEWHSSHRMPPRPTARQRAEWHHEHALNCGCREITPAIAELLRSQGFDMPATRHDEREQARPKLTR